MATKSNDILKVQLKDVRLSFPQLFKAKAFGDGTEGQPAYSAEFLIDKDSRTGKNAMDAIEDAMDEARAILKQKDPKGKISKDKPCYKDGDDEDYSRPETEGCMILSARNSKKPRILDIDKTDLREEDGVIYGGCFVDAIVRIWAQDNRYGRRVNCSLEAVRFRRDGDPFGAAPIDPDEFDDIEDEGDNERRSSRSSSRRASRDDDEDDKPARRRASRDDDEDDKPARRRASRDDDEDDKPARRRASRDDDDEDDKPTRRRASRDDDDEDDKPTRRRASRDDDEDDKPARRRASRDDDDDEDDKPARRRASRDDDEDEDKPSRNSRSKRSEYDDV